MKNKTKLLWIFIGIGAFAIVFLMMLSSILDIGDRLALISPWLQYVFYGLALILFVILIANPIRIIVFSPSLSIATTMDKESSKTRKIYAKVTENIKSNNELSEDEIRGIDEATNFEELKLALNTCYDTTIKKRISNIIYNNAKTVMISTAICQNAKLDMYSVVAVNLKMIKEIVEASGFRPSYKNLGKLSVNVLTTALVAEGLENVNIDDVLPNSAMTALGEIPLVKPLISSILQGTSNGLLTLRIGFVCRKYLFADLGQTKSQIRAEAFKESMKMLPRLIADVTTYFPSKMLKLFTKKDKEVKEV